MRTELDTAIMPVTGNRVQLQQVLYNLLSNAIEAMESVADRTMLVKSEHENSGQVRGPSNIPELASSRNKSTKSSIHFHDKGRWHGNGSVHLPIDH